MAKSSQPTQQMYWSAGQVIVATIAILLVAIIFFLMYRFSNVLFVFFVAIVLGTAIRPAVLWLERRHVPTRLGILLIFVVIGLAAVAVIALLAPLLITQATELFSSFPGYYTQVVEQLRGSRNPVLRVLATQLPRQVQFDAGFMQGGSQFETVAQAVGYVRSFGWNIFAFVAALLIIYFWILDREQIVQSGLLLLPDSQRNTARGLLDTLEEKVGAFVRGQAILCLSIGLASALAFFAIGIPNALLLAVLAGIFEAVPYVGPILTAVLVGTVTLAQAPEKIWWTVGALIAIQQLENSVLVPRIMDRAVGVNAVVTLLAIIAFGTLLGIGGAIMAIPLAVILQILFQQWVRSVQQGPAQDITGRDQTAVLHYQAQELAHDLRTRIRDHPHELQEEPLEEQLEQIVTDLDGVLLTVSRPGPAGAHPPTS